MGERGSPAPAVVEVDRVACTGHGVCAALLPGAVRLDEWGYPVLAGQDGGLPRATAQEVAAAVRHCPARALRLSGWRR